MWKTTWLCWRMSYSEPSPSKVSVLFSEKHSDQGDCTYVWHTHTKPLCYEVLSPIWLIEKCLGGTYLYPWAGGYLEMLLIPMKGLGCNYLWFRHYLQICKIISDGGEQTFFMGVWLHLLPSEQETPIEMLCLATFCIILLFGFSITCKENK